jgi:hypothetical protein
MREIGPQTKGSGNGLVLREFACASQLIIRTGIIEVSRYSQKYDMPWLQNETHRNSRCSNAQKEQSSLIKRRKSRGRDFLLKNVYALYSKGTKS